MYADETHAVSGPGYLKCAPSGTASSSRSRLVLPPEDRYARLSGAYQRHRGLADLDDVLGMLRRSHPQPLSRLARWIVDRSLTSVPWRGRTLVPLFQFTFDPMMLDPAVQAVVGELTDVLDAWELAEWFVAPNIWLQEATPIERLQDGSMAVLDAARADRFVLRG